MAKAPCRDVLASGLWCDARQREQGRKLGYIFLNTPLKCLLAAEKKWSIFLAVCLLGQDVHAEESLLISGLCGDSNPVPVRCPSGGLGPPDKMVKKCSFVPCASATHGLNTSWSSPPPPLFFANCPLFVLVCRFNISPLSVNISTTEFSLLDSLPKVNPHNSPGEVILYVMAAKWLYQFFKCRYIFLPLPIHSILPLFLFCRQARARRTWLEKVSCVCCCSPGRPERSL